MGGKGGLARRQCARRDPNLSGTRRDERAHLGFDSVKLQQNAHERLGVLANDLLQATQHFAPVGW